jgi:hypothetical protein
MIINLHHFGILFYLFFDVIRYLYHRQQSTIITSELTIEAINLVKEDISKL